MRWLAILTTALCLVAAATGAARAAVPATITFTAYLDEGGVPMSGTEDFELRLITGPPDVVVWAETRDDVEIVDGFVAIELGTVDSLLGVFSGMPMELEVSLRGITLSPRIEVTSVPYAHRAGVADSLAGLGPGDVQQRVAGTCPGGAIQTINADGTVVCVTAGGDVTGVSTPAGGGLTGGSQAGDAALALLDCAPGQILRDGPAGWACAADNAGAGACPAGQFVAGFGAASGAVACATDAGDISSVGAGSGLVGGGTSGAVTLALPSCGSGMVLKVVGNAWQCAAPPQGLIETVASTIVSQATTIVSTVLNVPAAGQAVVDVRWSGNIGAGEGLDCQLAAVGIWSKGIQAIAAGDFALHRIDTFSGPTSRTYTFACVVGPGDVVPVNGVELVVQYYPET